LGKNSHGGRSTSAPVRPEGHGGGAENTGGLGKGEPILSESQVELIKHHTAFLGEDGEAVMQEIQEEATKTVRLPADIAKIIDNYCKDLA
jgi:hypothetical protein